jgi:hypothetical protein
VSFAAITLYVAPQRVFIFVGVYFVIDSVRKLLDTASYLKLAFKIIENVEVEIRYLARADKPSFLS